MPSRFSTALILLVSLALTGAACGSKPGGPGAGHDGGSPTPADDSTVARALPEGPSALDDIRAPGLPEPLIEPAEIVSGGPPPDGIPPIDNPVFVTVGRNLDLLDSSEAVVALVVGDDARAYPVRVMIWHEIVNDTVGGVPVSITYCPLCNSAVSYRREVRGNVTTFGTSGRLFASALVMYDRATESLWTHFDGRAVVGLLTGDTLEPIASPLMAWEEFRAAYPDGLVLDPAQTGFDRRYGANPYAGYDDPEASPFLFRGPVDDRARAMQRVVGLTVGDTSTAFTLDSISGGAARATNSAVGGVPIAILWRSGQSSALESAGIGDGRDVGSVVVVDRRLDGTTLTFEVRDGAFVDRDTNSTWNLFGEAIDGALEGTSLDRVNHLDTFWFAWSTYRPGTTLETNEG